MTNTRFIIQVCKGLIRDLRARRWVMFYTVLAALVMLFLGSTAFWTLLRERPIIFLLYWGACAWLTLLAALLALYDLLRVRAEAARARQQLEGRFGVRPTDDEEPR